MPRSSRNLRFPNLSSPEYSQAGEPMMVGERRVVAGRVLLSPPPMARHYPEFAGAGSGSIAPWPPACSAVLKELVLPFGSDRRLSAVQTTPAVRHRGRP
jgi:hypothetical protein